MAQLSMRMKIIGGIDGVERGLLREADVPENCEPKLALSLVQDNGRVISLTPKLVRDC